MAVDELHRKVLEATKAVLVGLVATDLSDFSTDNIKIRKLARLTNQTLPGIAIAPVGSQMIDAASGQDRIGYGVLIGIATAGNKNLDDLDGLWDELSWRETITFALHNQDLTITVGGSPKTTQPCRIEAGEPIVAQLFNSMIDAQWLLLRCPIIRNR